MRIGKRTNRRLWSGTAVAALLGVLALALLAWLVAVPAIRVHAAAFNVNVTSDGLDANPGDGFCDDGAGNCTLRAAIDEANATVDNDIINVITPAAISLTNGPLPLITDHDLVINGNGREVSMVGAGSAFTIDADRVHMNDLVIDGEGVGTTGVRVSGNTDDLVLDGLTIQGFTADGFNTSPGGKRNTVRNSTVTANGADGIDFNGGEDNSVQDSTITNNGSAASDAGIKVRNQDDFSIRGNTLSGNVDDQINIGSLQAGQHVTIIQNTITSGSDGIQVDALVSATADIDIGLTFDNRNVFRGAISAPGEQHLRNLSGANINAIYNDWDAYNPAGIEGVICHNGEAGCGAGVVDFDPFVDTPSPLPTPTPLATPTPAETATPTPPAETPTPTPGDVETVPLIAGCNPAASTYPDGTPIGTIADAVTPPGILSSLWEFEAGFWLGYSPFFPEVSDLTEKDFLDVVFICVDVAGTFERPLL